LALEAGRFELAVGASSRDLRLSATVEIDAPRISLPLTEMSTLQEWLADPEGGRALRAAIGTDDSGAPKGILGDPELIAVIGNFPIGRLAAFPGIGIDQATLRAILG
jgi:beta-glucosidase